MFKRALLLCLVSGALVSLSLGCDREGEGVLLRFSPQVGASYTYRLQVADRIDVSGEMRVLSQRQNGYEIAFSGLLDGELFGSSMTLSERHNADHPGYITLNFPSGRVVPGAEWEGEVPWYFENAYVLDPTQHHLPASYKLLRIEQGEHGRRAIIEQAVDVAVAADGLVFYIGQVGVRWDRAGRITALQPGYDASGKLQLGDVVVGVNGRRAGSADELKPLAEMHIQHPKEATTVAFTILRDGEELDIPVEKTIDELALVRVYNVKNLITAAFDVDRGLLLSAEVNTNYDVAFATPATGAFPIVDDYAGFSKFGYLEGQTAYQTHYGIDGVVWSLSLVE